MTESRSFHLATRLHPAFSSASPTSTTILRRYTTSFGLEESDQQPYQLNKIRSHSWFTQRNWEGKGERVGKAE